MMVIKVSRIDVRGPDQVERYSRLCGETAGFGLQHADLKWNRTAHPVAQRIMLNRQEHPGIPLLELQAQVQ
jgi:hypothetical protein